MRTRVSTWVVVLIAVAGFQAACVSVGDPPEGAGTEALAPVADAGPNQAVALNATVTLDGSGSYDPNTKDELTYAWRFVQLPSGATAPALSGGTTDTATFVAAVAGQYVARLTVSDGTLTSQDEVTIHVSAGAPVADAGDDQVAVNAGTSVVLDAGASYDPGGGALAYEWSLLTKPLGSAAALSNTTLVQTSFVPDVVGDYVAVLVVRTGSEVSAPDSITITVDNTRPVASAGADVSVYLGQTATLDGSASSDIDGDPLTYAWSLLSRPSGSSVTLGGSTTANPTLAPDVAGVYVARLFVSDGRVTSSADDVRVVAASPVGNSAPVASAGADLMVEVNTPARPSADDSVDPNGDVLSYAWTVVSAPASSTAVVNNPTFVSPTFVPDLAGAYVLRVTVSDGLGGVDTDDVTITADTRPVANGGSDRVVLVGASVVLDASGSTDADAGDTLTYAWTLTKPAGSSAFLSSPVAVTPSFTADKPGEYIATLVVSDAKLLSYEDPVVVFAHRAPVANAGADGYAAIGAPTVLSASGSTDADGDALSFAWTVVSRPGGSTATLSNANTVSPSITADVLGSYTLRVTVTDARGASSTDDVVLMGDTRPVADAGNSSAVSAGSTVTLDGSGSSDADAGDTLTYLWTLTPPAGSAASLSDPTSDSPQFTTDVPGAYIAMLVVSDGKLFSAPDTVTVTVTAGAVTNIAPIADARVASTGTSSASVPTGALVVLDGSQSSDANGDALSYSWSFVELPPTTPAWFTLNNAGVVNPSFVPPVAGVYKVRLVVNDGKVDSTPDTVTVTAANLAPVAAAGVDQTVPVGALVRLDGRGSTDANGDAIAYQWTITSKPVGSATLLSSPTAATPTFVADVAGTYTVTLVASDGLLSSTPDSMTVLASAAAPTANAGIDEAALPGDVVVLNGSASSDPGALTLSYAWSFVTWPAGAPVPLLLDETTVTPSFEPLAAGVYEVALVVTNTIPLSSVADIVRIVVREPPVAHAGDDVETLIDNECFAPRYGYGGEGLWGDYEGTPLGEPYTFAWAFTAVPGGSTLAGLTSTAQELVFVPDVPGNYTARFTVTDAYGASHADTVIVHADTPVIQVTNGSGQSAPVFSALSAPLTFRVVGQTNGVLARDAGGCNSYQLLFDSPVGGGSVSTTSSYLDSSANATITGTLGGTMGAVQFRARLAHDTAVSATVSATATADDAVYLVIEPPMGSSFSVDGGVAVGVRVTDQYFNTVTSYGATSVTLGVDGRASFHATNESEKTKLVALTSGVGSATVYGRGVETVRITGTDTAPNGLRILGRQTLVDEDFESGPGPFVTRGSRHAQNAVGTNEWEHGTATSGPAAAHSGTNLWGTDLDGVYGSTHDASLVLPGVDFTNIAADVPRSAVISFWHWEDMYNRTCTNYWDDCNSGAMGLFGASPVGLNYIEDSSPWGYVAPLSDSPDGGYVPKNSYLDCGYTTYRQGYSCRGREWRQATFDLTPLAGQVADLQWAMVNDTDYAQSGAGWFIDDVRLDLVFNGQAVIAFGAGAPAKVALKPVANTMQGLSMIVEVETQDQYGNFVAPGGPAPTVQLDVSGTSNVTFGLALEGGATPLGTSSTVVTLVDGVAALTLEQTVSSRETVTVTASSTVGGYPVAAPALRQASFTGTATTLCLTGGDAQSGSVSAALASPLQVRLLDEVVADCSNIPLTAFGVSAPIGWTVTSGSGSLSSAVTGTDVTGAAASVLTLGTSTGAVTVRATVLTQPSLFVDFTAIAVPGAAERLVMLTPANASVGSTGSVVTLNLVDHYGNIVDDDSSRFRVNLKGFGSFEAGGTVSGDFLANLGSAAIVELENGVADFVVKSTVPNLVTLGVEDSYGTGVVVPLGYYDRTTSTQTLVCGGGGANTLRFFDVPTFPANATLQLFGSAALYYYYAELAVSGETEGATSIGTAFRGYLNDCQPYTSALTVSAATMAAFAGDGTVEFVTRSTADVTCGVCASDLLSARLLWDGGGKPITFFGNDVCAAAEDLTSQVLGAHGTTRNAANDHAPTTTGGCNATHSAGLDVMYKVTLTTATQDLRVRVTPKTALHDVSVVVTDDCAVNVCRGSRNSAGAGGVEDQLFNDLGVGTHYIVIDSPNGTSGDFLIDVVIYP